jgi:TolB protein
MMSSRLRWLLAFGVSALAGVSFLASIALPAGATVPGKNSDLAFRRYLDTNESWGAIFVVGPDGKNERQLTRPPQGVVDEQPDWSPDGSRIVFHREYQDKPFEVFSIKADGSDLRQLDPGCPAGIPATQICEENQPAWSPDGRRIAFFWPYGRLKMIRGEEWIEVGAIAVMDADGGNVRQLTQLRRPTSSEDIEPVWSPDGKRIAFVRLNSTAQPHDGRAIFVMNADGSGQRRLTPWRLNAGDHPDWSPDGKQILFRSPTEELVGTNLYTVRPDGGELRRLTRFGKTVEVLSASFSPDGKWIVFAKTGAKGQPDLFVMRSDGNGMRQVTRTGDWESAPDWGPRAR